MFKRIPSLIVINHMNQARGKSRIKMVPALSSNPRFHAFHLPSREHSTLYLYHKRHHSTISVIRQAEAPENQPGENTRMAIPRIKSE